MADRLLSPKELAEYLGIPLSTIYKWNYSGEGPRRLKLGKHCRYRTADVDRWLDSQQTTSAAS